MNKYIVNLFLLLILSLSSYGHIERAKKEYSSYGYLQIDKPFCITRYQQELEFTSEINDQLISGRVCANQNEINTLIAEVNLLLSDNTAPVLQVSTAYKKLMDNLAECRMSFLMNPAGPMNEETQDERSRKKVFLHVLGDAFGLATGLEGENSSRMLLHRYKQLSDIRDKMSRFTFINDIDQARPCYRLETQMPEDLSDVGPKPDIPVPLLDKLLAQTELAMKLVTKSMQPSLVEFRDFLATSLYALKPKESLFFPSAWSGHAIVFELEREDDEHIRFRMFNSGDGIEAYHVKGVMGHQVKYAPYVELLHVPIKNMTSLVVLSALKEVHSPKGASSKPTHFYARFLLLLGGQVAPPIYEADFFKDPQHSGTCSYASLPWVMTSCINDSTGTMSSAEKESLGGRVEYLMQLLTLMDYSSRFSTSEKMQNDEEAQHLLQKGLAYFSGASADAINGGVATSKELSHVTAALRNIYQNVRQVQAKRVLKNQEQAPKFAWHRPAETTFPAFKREMPDIHTLRGAKSLLEATDKDQEAAAKPMFHIELPQYFSQNNSEQIQALGEYTRQLEEGLSGEHYANIMTYISSIAQKLSVDPGAWRDISQDEASAGIKHLSKLGELYLFAVVKLISEDLLPESQITSEMLLTTIKLLTVADVINRNIFKVDVGIASLYSPSWGNIIMNDSTTLLVVDPNWQKELIKLRAYYQDNSYDADLFALNKLPAGANYSRRIFDDVNAIDNISVAREDDIKWEDLNLKNADVAWAIALIQKQSHSDEYRAWREFALGSENIGNIVFQWFPEAPPGIIPRDPIKRDVNSILIRRAAIKLVAGQSFSNNDFLKKEANLFQDLRRLSLVANFLLTGDLSKNRFLGSGPSDYHKGINYDFTPEQISITESYELQDSFLHQKKTTFDSFKIGLNVFGVENAKFKSMGAGERVVSLPGNQGKFSYRDPATYLMKSNKMFNIFDRSTYWNENLNRDALVAVFDRAFEKKVHVAGRAPTRVRMGPDDVATSNPKDLHLSELGLERTRALLNLSSTKELQLDKTLGYFFSKPFLLAADQKSYRALFEKLMFDQDLLTKELSEVNQGQALAERMASFCRRIYNYYRPSSDIRALAFILRMNDLFKVHAENHHLATAAFMDSVPLLLQLTTKLQPSQTQERSFVLRNILEVYLNRSNLSVQDVKILLMAAVGHNTIKLVDKHWLDEDAEARVKNILPIKQDQINAALKTDANDILSAVLTSIYPERRVDGTRWTRANDWDPLFKTQVFGVHFYFDIAEGAVYEDGNKIVSFPIATESYTQVFGNLHPAPLVATQIGKNIYEWTDLNSQNVIRAQIEGHRYPFFLRLEGSRSFFLLSNYEAKKMGDSQAVNPGFNTWLEVSLKGRPTEMLISDRHSGEIVRRVKVTSSPYKKPKVESITRTKDQAAQINSIGETEFAAFKAIEDERHIYVWRLNDGGLEVSLPRLGLTFNKLPEEEGLDCASFTDYKLANQHFSVMLDKPFNYLLCEPRTGSSATAKIAIMVAQPFTKTAAKTALVASGFFPDQKKEDFEQNFADQLMVYRLPDDQSQSIVPQTLAGRYYLALRYLWQQKYRLAQATLLGETATLNRFTPFEIELLSQIVKGNEQDHDVRALAMRLQALHFLGQDFLHFDGYPVINFHKDNPNYLGQLIKDNLGLYEEFLSKVDTIGSGYLDKNTELVVAQWFAKSVTDAPKERWAEKKAHNAQERRILNRLTELKNYEGVAESLASNNTLHILERDDKAKDAPQIAKPPTINRLKDLWPKSRKNINIEEGVLNISSYNPIVNLDTFGIFYEAAISENLSVEHRQEALNILSKVLSIGTQFDHLTDQEIRDELMWVARFSSINPPYSMNVQWEMASFIPNIYDLKDKSQIALIPWMSSNSEGLSLKKYLERDYENEADKVQQIEGIFNEIFNQFDQTEHNLYPHIDAGQIPALAKMPKEMRRSEVPQFLTGLAQIAVEDRLRESMVSAQRKAAIFSEHKNSLIKNGLETAWQLISQRLNEAKNASKTSSEVKLSVDALLKRIKTKYEEIQKNKKQFLVSDWSELRGLKDEVDHRLVGVNKSLVLKKDRILALARKYDPDQTDANYDELLRLADIGKEVEFDDVIYLLLTNNLEKFYALNGSITLEETTELAKEALQYLADTTYANHLTKLGDELALLITQEGQSPESIDYQLAVENVMGLINTTRSYEISEHIEYLVFEYFMGIIIRPNQKLALDTLEIKNGKIGQPDSLGKVLELIMGAGKTSVILPLICALQADKEWLNVVVLPESLIASMAKELAGQLGKSFKKHITLLELSRAHSLTKEQVGILKERIENAKNEGVTVVTTNSSLQGLFLAGINRFETPAYFGKGDARIPLNEIFDIFRKHGKLTIDEVDLALDVMRAQQIAAGQKIAICEELKATVSSLYEMMATRPIIFEAYALPFLPHASGEPVTDESFVGLKELLIKNLLSLENGSFLKNHGDLNQLYIEYLAQNGDADLLAYWRQPTVSSRTNVMSKIADNRLKDVVAIIAEELNGTLLLTAKKKLNIHFGALIAPSLTNDSPEAKELYNNLKGEYEKSRFVAIPYHNGTPMVQSRFASAIESVNYTIQKDLKEQNIVPYILLEIEQLKKLGSGSPYFNPRYMKLMGADTKTDINELTEQEIADAAQSYRAQDKISEHMKFISSHALPQIGAFTKQLQTNAQIYEFLFHTVRGFSGTLWSYQTFPDIFSKAILSDTSAVTLLALLSSPTSVLPLIPGFLDELVKQVYDDWEQPGSFIDEAGIFRAYSNQNVAEAIIKYLVAQNVRQVEGVIYYDDKGEIVIVDKKFHSVPLARSTIPRDKQIAYWDKQHTTGSDLKLFNRMQAKLSVDHHLKLRDAEQASFRLRGLGMGQRIVQLVLWAEDMETISKKLTSTYELRVNELSPVDILCYAVLNQEEYLSFLKWRGFGQKLKNKLVKEAVHDIFDATVPLTESEKSFKNSRDLFVMKAAQHPHEIYGLPSELLPKEKAIALEVDLIKNNPSYKVLGGERMEDAIAQTVATERPFLPDFILMPRFAHQGTEVQIELNLQQMQTQTQTQTQVAPFEPHKQSPYPQVKTWGLQRNQDEVYRESFLKNNPLMVGKEQLLDREEALKPLFKALEPELYFSGNYAPVENERFMPFDQFGKELTEVLVVYNRISQTYSLIMFDGNDSREWKEFLLGDDGQNAKSRELDFALYDLRSGKFMAQGTPTWDGQQPEENQAFVRLIAQAKFLGGLLDYSQPEKMELANWINNSDNPKVLKQIFRTYIMAYRDDTITEYLNSYLAEIFGDQR
jgi:hypothetical protein